MSLPIMLNLQTKKTLVIGGGKIGSRKALSLLAAGAEVTCISLSFTEDLANQEDHIRLIKRNFKSEDIQGNYLVIAATDDIKLNKKVYERCFADKILCQTVDSSNVSDFDFMATKRWQNLVIAVSTLGKAPGFSKQLIKNLATVISEEELLELQKEIENRKSRNK